MSNYSEMLSVCLSLAGDLPKTHGQHRFWCIITDKKGRVISQSGNSYSQTHPTQARYAKRVNQDDRVYLHAEISSLVKMRSTGHTLFVARMRNDHFPGSSKPCPICSLAIREAGIKKVVYIDDNGEEVSMRIGG